MITGLDVSYWQGSINWQSVCQAGYRFAFARASQGATYTDPTFAANVTGAKANGIFIGAFHYFQLAQPAQAQAQFFLSKIKDLKLDLPPALDYEDPTTMSKTAAAAALKTWLDIVEAGTGRKPIVYTNANFWDTYIGNPAWAKDYPLWVANWTAGAEPYKPKSWSSWLFWQHSNQGTIPGINAHVDLDRFALSEDELLKLAGKQIIPEPPKTLEERVAALETTLTTIKDALKAKGVL